MMNLAIFYGGKSAEHDISVITAIQVMKNLDKTKYNIVPVFIDENNSWYVLKDYLNLNIYANKKYCGKRLVGGFFNKNLVTKSLLGYKKYIKIDVAINCMHGLNGEDGTLAGLLELNNIIYVGSGVLTSGIGMDKCVQKDLLKVNGFSIPKYMYFNEVDYLDNEELLINQAEETIKYPVVIKPANLGSSIGINIAENREMLKQGIKTALSFDKKVILEEKICNLREINCSVLGGYKNMETSVLEEPKNWKKFLDFNEKYLSKDNNKKDINVVIGDGIDEKIKSVSKQIFKLFGASGVVRIDFLLNNQTKQVFVNEINTIPGSLANYLWKHKYSFGELLDRLIENAQNDYKYKRLHKYAYTSDVLKSYKNCKCGGKISKNKML